MNSRQSQLRQRRHARSGLAPVELVLSLPVWMLLASAMVIVGNLGAWKIRGHLAVREAAVRQQWPRTRAGDANPGEWSRPSAAMQSTSASAIDQSDPLQAHAVIRGPQLVVPAAVAIGVDGMVMSPDSVLAAGEAFLNEPPPLWPRSGIRSRFSRQFPVLNGNCGQWQPGPAGALRAPQVWELPPLE